MNRWIIKTPYAHTRVCQVNSLHKFKLFVRHYLRVNLTRFPKSSIEETKETHTINSWYWIKFAKIHFWYWCCIFVEILCSPPPLRHDRCSPLHRGVRAVNWPNELSSIFVQQKTSSAPLVGHIDAHQRSRTDRVTAVH